MLEFSEVCAPRQGSFACVHSRAACYRSHDSSLFHRFSGCWEAFIRASNSAVLAELARVHSVRFDAGRRLLWRLGTMLASFLTRIC